MEKVSVSALLFFLFSFLTRLMPTNPLSPPPLLYYSTTTPVN